VVVVQVWDLSGQFPLGFQKVELQVLQKAQVLAQAEGREKVTLRDLDLAQVQGTEWEWVQVTEQESALPQGYRLDSEQGLVRDWESVQVVEMELG
jgi:hypothetical protein